MVIMLTEYANTANEAIVAVCLLTRNMLLISKRCLCQKGKAFSWFCQNHYVAASWETVP